uniref:Uncharacterized protein n=1 Tax=Arundo donax TaxID=35708 RepID=A0A0A8Z4T4_ARUDO
MCRYRPRASSFFLQAAAPEACGRREDGCTPPRLGHQPSACRRGWVRDSTGWRGPAQGGAGRRGGGEAGAG